MKVFFYIASFPPSGEPLVGGMKKAVDGLAKSMAHQGADVTVICEGPDDGPPTRSRAGYLIQAFSLGGLLQSFFRKTSLSRFIEREMQDAIVVLNGIWNPRVFLMSRLVLAKKVPYVVAPHNPHCPMIFEKRRLTKWLYWHVAEKKALAAACAVQLLDHEHEVWLRRLGINTPAISVPNGYSDNDVLPEDALTFHSEERIRLIYFGRLDAYHKGLDLLIQAVHQVHGDTDIELTLQGPDWNSREDLERQAEACLSGGTVRFLNPDYEMLPAALLAKYDIFCMPSRYEGFGLSALEAMLAGRVVLVSKTAGIASHVAASDCGVLVDPDVASIENGLNALLTRRDEWPEMGMRGRRYVLEMLRWDRIASEAHSDYARLAKLPDVGAPHAHATSRTKRAGHSQTTLSLTNVADAAAPASIPDHMSVPTSQL